MSGDIGPGTFVECIDPAAPGWAFGHLFVVAEVVDCVDHCFACGDPLPGVTLDDPRCGSSNAYCTGCQVRPIYRPKSDFIESLKAHAPKREPELT